MNAALETLLRFYPGDTVALWLVNMMLQATALSLVSLLAIRLFARRQPSFRYLFSLCGLIGLLLCPLLSFATGRSGMSLFAIPLLSLVESSPMAAVSLVEEAQGQIAPERAQALPSISRAQKERAALALLFWLWVAGVVAGVLRLVKGWRQTVRVRREGQPPDEAAAARLSQVLQQGADPFDNDLSRFAVSDRLASPVVVGVFRPSILLPRRLLTEGDDTALRAILLHEGGHVRLRHPLGGVGQRLAGVLFWPNPLIYALCRTLARSREEVCDNCALQGVGAACYARTLLALAESAFSAPECSSALAILGPGWRLEERITGLLDPRRDRMTHTNRGKVWTVLAVLGAALAGVAGIRVVAAAQDPDPSNPSVTVTLPAGSKLDGVEVEAVFTLVEDEKPAKARPTAKKQATKANARQKALTALLNKPKAATALTTKRPTAEQAKPVIELLPKIPGANGQREDVIVTDTDGPVLELTLDTGEVIDVVVRTQDKTAQDTVRTRTRFVPVRAKVVEGKERIVRSSKSHHATSVRRLNRKAEIVSYSKSSQGKNLRPREAK